MWNGSCIITSFCLLFSTIHTCCRVKPCIVYPPGVPCEMSHVSYTQYSCTHGSSPSPPRLAAHRFCALLAYHPWASSRWANKPVPPSFGLPNCSSICPLLVPSHLHFLVALAFPFPQTNVCATVRAAAVAQIRFPLFFHVPLVSRFSSLDLPCHLPPAALHPPPLSARESCRKEGRSAQTPWSGPAGN